MITTLIIIVLHLAMIFILMVYKTLKTDKSGIGEYILTGKSLGNEKNYMEEDMPDSKTVG